MKRGPTGHSRERVFRFVQARLQAGEPPTIREVQEACGFRSIQTAREHLEALVNENRLTKQSGKSRSYRLPNETPQARMVPVLGQVQAGSLTTAVQDLDGYLPVCSRDAEDCFALRVKGMSMIGVGILPGDLVVVHQQDTANSGNIVVALVDGEATVKTFRHNNDRVELHAENPAFEPIIADGEDVQILGKVVEVRRIFDQSVGGYRPA